MSEKENKTLQKRQVAEEKAAKQKKKYTWIKLIVGLCVVLCIVLTVFESNFICRLLPAVNVGNTSYSVAEYNVMYTNSFNQVYSNLVASLGDYASYVVNPQVSLKEQQYSEDMTWADYIKDYTEDTLEMITALNDEAASKGFELDKAYTDQIDADWETLGQTAASYGYTTADYAVALYGKGVNEKVFRSINEKYYKALSYGASVNDGLEITRADMDARYKEDPKNYDAVTYQYYYLSAAAAEGEDAAAVKETAKQNADAILTAEDRDAYLAENMNGASFTEVRYGTYGNMDTSYADWLYDDARKAGDANVFETENGYYVIVFGAKEDLHYNTVTVRHLLVKPGNTEDEAAWDEAKTAVEGYKATWETLGGGEENFTSIALAYSADEGTKSIGGLCENVYKGQMVTEFENWCFDPARKAGDCDIIRTEYGYHLMYFVEEGPEYYENLIGETLRNEQYNAYVEALMEGYTVSDGAGMPLAAKHFA